VHCHGRPDLVRDQSILQASVRGTNNGDAGVLDLYRDKHGSLSDEDNTTTLGKLRNRQIRSRAEAMCTKLRAALNQHAESTRMDPLVVPFKTQIARMESATQTCMAIHASVMNDVVMLRDEVLARLSSRGLSAQSNVSRSNYQHPTNPLGVEALANDLEYLYKLLPD